MQVSSSARQHQTGRQSRAGESVFKKVLCDLEETPTDYNKTVATTGIYVLYGFMKTQEWPIAELQRPDLETRKILVESGVKQGSTELLYLPRSVRGAGGGSGGRV